MHHRSLARPERNAGSHQLALAHDVISPGVAAETCWHAKHQGRETSSLYAAATAVDSTANPPKDAAHPSAI